MADLRSQLEYAAESCYCESYYSYTCRRCRAPIPDMAEAVELGYVTWEGYGEPNLTEAGKCRLKEMKACDRS